MNAGKVDNTAIASGTTDRAGSYRSASATVPGTQTLRLSLTKAAVPPMPSGLLVTAQEATFRLTCRESPLSIEEPT